MNTGLSFSQKLPMKAIANLLCKLKVIGLFFVETVYYSLTLILAYPVVP